jgi:hypothetical protein
MLLWDELKARIPASERDSYARQVGVARIARNEDAHGELAVLREMEIAIDRTLAVEIERKNPAILASAQRTAAIARAVALLDALRAQGQAVDPRDCDDSQVLRYLRLTRMARPATAARLAAARASRGSRSARAPGDTPDSAAEIQALMDDEYARLQAEAGEIRCALFSRSEQLQEVKAIEPPPTQAIETFSKRLKTQRIACRSIAKAQGPMPKRLRDSVRLSRLWE